MSINIKDKTSSDLIDEFAKISNHNTLECEQYDAAIHVQTTREMVNSANYIAGHIKVFKNTMRDTTNEVKASIVEFNKTVDNMRVSSDQLSAKLLWLNIVLTAATVIGTFFGVLSFFKG